MPSGCWAVPLGVVAIAWLVDVDRSPEGSMPWWSALVGLIFLATAVEQLWAVVRARRAGRSHGMFGAMVLLACAVAWLSQFIISR